MTPDSLRHRASRLLSQVTTLSDRLVNDGLGRADARKWHVATLASLHEHGPASQAALSRRTGIYRSDMVAVIGELAARDLVEQAPDPRDRRRHVITITPAGERHLRALQTILDDVHQELLAPLDPAEREQLVHLLTRLLEHHGR